MVSKLILVNYAKFLCNSKRLSWYVFLTKIGPHLSEASSSLCSFYLYVRRSASPRKPRRIFHQHTPSPMHGGSLHLLQPLSINSRFIPEVE